MLLRFRISTNASGTGDGWHIDDISVAESPARVEGLTVDAVTSHSLHLSWDPSSDDAFSWYGIFRDSSWSIGFNSTLVGIVTDQSVTEFTDTGLKPNTTYYYRVFAVNPWGTFSPYSPYSVGHTLSTPLPYQEDFEGSLDMWDLNGGFGPTNEDSLSGLRSLTDSPGTPYPNNSSTTARLTVDLTGTTWPVLRFWSRAALADSQDYGRISIGDSYSYRYEVHETRLTWEEQAIDLSEWKDNSAVRIQLVFSSDDSGNDDGWYIDDLSVQQESHTPTALPFVDGVEAGIGRWLPAGWTVSTESASGGTHSFRGSLPRSSATHDLVLAGEVELPHDPVPVLSYSLRGSVAGEARLQAQVSDDHGEHWSTVTGWYVTTDVSTSWRRFFVPLAEFAGETVRLRFRLHGSTAGAEDLAVFLDDISLTAEDDTVQLLEATPGFRTVALSWSPSSLGSSFSGYYVYRADQPDITSEDTLVFSTNELNQTSFTDTGLEPGKTYYYRVFTLASDLRAYASNELSATTSSMSIPFWDQMETLDNWITTGSWGLDTTHYLSGHHALSDSPGGDYSPEDSGSYAETVVDLTGTTWPVLRFYDRFSFGQSCYSTWYGEGRVDVSPDGDRWTTVYQAVGARSSWERESVDLSPWKSCSTLRIRFVIRTDYGSIRGDGWYIDDVSVAENSGTVEIPFADHAESSPSNWLAQGWKISLPDQNGNHSYELDLPDFHYPPSTVCYYLELAWDLDLRAHPNLELVFQIWEALYDHDWYDLQIWCQISTDGGVTWLPLRWISPGGPSPTYIKIPLSGYQQPGVRIRLEVRVNDSHPRYELHLDNIILEDRPQPVVLNEPISHLKTIDLTWSPTTLGADFVRYEVYRSLAQDVEQYGRLIYSTDDPNVTSFTDSGLEIGETYYYAVMVVNRREVTGISNVQQAALSPLPLPLIDPMENLDNWLATGNWGPNPSAPHSGSYSLSDSGAGTAPADGTTSITTAVDLSNAVWPVLRFWERASLSDRYDRILVSVGPPDGMTTVYSVQENQPAWLERSIDLSPWRGQPLVVIKLSRDLSPYVSDPTGSSWSVDDLSITDVGLRVSAPPFVDGIESDPGEWLPLGWEVSEETPHSGARCLHSPSPSILRTTYDLPLVLAREVDLSQSTRPVFGFWIRSSDTAGTPRIKVSENSGLTWATVPETRIARLDPTSDWAFVQGSLAGHVGNRIRIKLEVPSYSPSSQPAWSSVDDLLVAEAPEPPHLLAPLPDSPTSLRLRWEPSAASDFAAYRLLRAESPSVAPEWWTPVATITDPSITAFTDTGLQPLKKYYYRLEVHQTSGVFSESDVASGITAGVPVPFEDDFEVARPFWYFTGDWQIMPGGGAGGTTGLVDSPGEYGPSSDTWAITGVDLRGTSWPVLTFRDRFDFEEGDYGALQISRGDQWGSIYYVAEGHQEGWAFHQIDLSAYKNEPIVWIRFRVRSDSGASTADGWHIDDVALRENPRGNTIPPPLVEDGESGLGNWLSSNWILTGDQPAEGTSCLVVRCSVSHFFDPVLILSLADSLNLSTTADPWLSFQLRGRLPGSSSLSIQLSTDGGLSWNSVFSANGGTVPVDWTRVRVPLTDFRTGDVRLRVKLFHWTSSDTEVFLDDMSIADSSPTAPAPSSPPENENVTELQPTLIVANATDYQGDPLFYEFRIYDDAALSHEVAGIPALAQQPDNTAWTVPVELQPSTEYWWRCRAMDSEGNTGPWMNTSTFFVQVDNRPPSTPQLVSPSNGTQLQDLSAYLTWLASSDPDAADGDSVSGYRIQIDDGSAFTSPEVDTTLDASGQIKDAAVSVALASLPGSGGLPFGARYYWRVAAVDSRGASSPWSAGPAYFVLGSDSDGPTCTIGFPDPGASIRTDPTPVTGSATDALSGIASVEVSTDGGQSWAPAVGTEDWLFSWRLPSAGDFLLSCRATDVAGNVGAPSAPILVHADLSRTVSFATASNWVYEDSGTANIMITLDEPRSVPVGVDIAVAGGTATVGEDYESPPQHITFAPGQTATILSIPVIADFFAEANETAVLRLVNPSPSDVIVGTPDTFTLTITNDDSRADLDLDGAVSGNDMVVLVLELFDLDGTSAGDVGNGANTGWAGYDLDGDGQVLASDVAAEIQATAE